MEFFDRDSEIAYMKRILEQYPRRIVFVYGPINSGKTALIVELLSRLDKEKFLPFYFNLREFQLSKYEDFVDLFFMVKNGFKGLLESLKLHSTPSVTFAGIVTIKIPISKEDFSLIRSSNRPEDAFSYIKAYFVHLVSHGLRPILVLDELQMMRGVKYNGLLLDQLFNFFVSLTKETHLAHVVAVTSDCLFIEHVYGVARLEGRVEYIKIDDLDKDRARELYENLELPKGRFEFVWGYLGGKINDYLALEMEYRAGMEIDVALERMLRDEMNRLLYLLMQFSYKEVRYVDEDGSEYRIEEERVKETLKFFVEKEEGDVIDFDFATLRYLIKENILFFDPVEGIVRPQSRLVHRAIKDLKLDGGQI